MTSHIDFHRTIKILGNFDYKHDRIIFDNVSNRLKIKKFYLRKNKLNLEQIDHLLHQFFSTRTKFIESSDFIYLDKFIGKLQKIGLDNSNSKIYRLIKNIIYFENWELLPNEIKFHIIKMLDTKTLRKFSLASLSSSQLAFEVLKKRHPRKKKGIIADEKLQTLIGKGVCDDFRNKTTINELYKFKINELVISGNPQCFDIKKDPLYIFAVVEHHNEDLCMIRNIPNSIVTIFMRTKYIRKIPLELKDELINNYL